MSATILVAVTACLWSVDRSALNVSRADVEQGLREMGVGPWLERGTLVVHRKPFGSFRSDPCYATLKLAAPDSEAMIAAIEKTGWTVPLRQPTTLPGEFGAPATTVIQRQLMSPQKNFDWWVYTLPDSTVVYIKTG